MRDFKIVNDPVHGSIKLSGALLELASTPEMNRLSQIRQLGLAYLVFPGAHHSRFEHSLGTSHIAGMLGRALDLPPDEVQLIAVCGALHDLGHGPFSHTMEKLFHDRLGKEHMALTKDLITGKLAPYDSWWWDKDWKDLESGRSVPEVLESEGLDPKRVAGLVCKDGSSSAAPYETLPVENGQAFFSDRDYLNQIIHGAVDADQLDFLLRDSHYTGVAYGIIDLERMVQTTLVHHGELMVHRRGLSALEGMLVARSLMYSSVYFHRTARIAEGMLCRAGDHLSDEALEQVWGMADGEVLRFMREQGGVPSRMAVRLRFRKLLKAALTLNSEDAMGDTEEALRTRELLTSLSDDRERSRLESEICRRAGVSEGEVIIDIPDPSLALSEPRLRRTDIKVMGDRPVPLYTISSLARALQRRPGIHYCLLVSCPEEKRDDVQRIARTLLGYG
jgi:hypothetical protein